MLVKEDDPAAQTISSLNDHCLAWHMVNHDQQALQTNLQELDVTKQLHQARGQTMALMEYAVQALVAGEEPETVTTDIPIKKNKSLQSSLKSPHFLPIGGEEIVHRRSPNTEPSLHSRSLQIFFPIDPIKSTTTTIATTITPSNCQDPHIGGLKLTR